MIYTALIYVQSAPNLHESVSWYEALLNYVGSGGIITPGLFFVSITFAIPKIIDSLFNGVNNRQKNKFEREYQMTSLIKEHEYRMKKIDLSSPKSTLESEDVSDIEIPSFLPQEEFDDNYFK